jgi:hypothetical protein
MTQRSLQRLVGIAGFSDHAEAVSLKRVAHQRQREGVVFGDYDLVTVAISGVLAGRDEGSRSFSRKFLVLRR